MQVKNIIAGAFCAFAVTANAQNVRNDAPENCRCEDSFEWLRSTFEANDAGFGYVVERKGRAAYDLHNGMTLEKVKAARTDSECAALLGEWLRFFRRGHIGIQPLRSGTPSPQTPAQNTVSERWNGDIPEFEKQMAVRQDAGYEGVWELESGGYTMGVKAEGDGYTGFIIKSNETDWEPGEVRMKIDREGNKWETVYYYKGQPPVYSGKPQLIENRVLRLLSWQTFRRVSPVLPDDPQIDNYLKAVAARTPYIEQLNPSTLYLRIPSFDSGQKAAIDKLIADNFDKLTSTEDLIIDLRNNGGGSDRSYGELWPLLYTGPVRHVGVSFRATPLNIEQFSERLNIEGLNEEERHLIAEFVETMKSRQGEFVSLQDEAVEVEIRDTVYEFPRRVGIIVNGSCGSTTEQFLLAAKQSLKVKLFGVTTLGALDASNMLTANSPDGKYRLSYTSSLSARIPGMAIDDIGLQPDFYIDKSIPDHGWVEYVSGILKTEDPKTIRYEK